MRRALLALVVPVAFLAWAAWPRSSTGTGACDAVPAADLAAVLHRPAGHATEGPADGSRRDATVCNYASGSTVFALTGGARRFYERHTADVTHLGPDASVLHDVFGDGRTDSLWLVRDDAYVNVLLHDPPDGAAEALAGRLLG